jgi:cellulose biosynthesis protein BcsQ
MIVSFYSFKGGVGRSLALAHTAWLLAARSSEQQILAVDLDLEAPGLDSYFEFPGLKECKGLAGLIQGYQQQPEAERREWLRRMLSDESHGYVVRPKGENERTNLWYLPSGLGRGRSASYRRVTAWLRKEIEMQDRSQGWPAAANRGFLGDCRAVLADSYAYTLIDSRTGLADEAFASTLLLAHALVVCFRLSDIHLQGIRSVVANFAKREGLPVDHPALPLIPVVTPLPTRGGPDIHRWLEDKVLPLFRRWQPPDDDLDTWERSPLLALDSPIVRLYEEPFLEIGQPMLVDRVGKLLPGFDDGVPLVAGYQSLLLGIVLLGYRHDLQAAVALEGHYLTRQQPQLALRYWRIQANATLNSFNVLGHRYSSNEAGPDALRSAVDILESWESRLSHDDDAGHDNLAYAWRSVLDLATQHDPDVVEGLGERAVKQARSHTAKGITNLRLAADLRSRLVQDAMGKLPSIRIPNGNNDPRVRILELLTVAEQELRAAEDWVLLYLCLQQQIDIYQEGHRYRKAVDALGRAVALIVTEELEETRALARQRVATLCLVLGQVSAAVHVGAQQESWIAFGLTYLLQLRWRNLAGGIAATSSADIDKDRRILALLARADATGADADRQISQELSQPMSLTLALFTQIVRGVPEVPVMGLESAIEDYPQLVPLHDIWARLFDQPRELSDAEVLTQIHRYNLDTSLFGIRAWLTDEPGQATRMLRRQLNQVGPLDARVRALVFYGLHTAFFGNAEISRRCCRLATEINECAPEVTVVFRNNDFWILADAVLAHLIREKRIDAERMILVGEWTTIIAAPPDLPEPETLAWSWEDGLPLDAMRRAAELLERLPDDIDEILAMPLQSS